MFRNVFWSIAKGVLTLLDGFFNILNTIWQYKFFDNEYVNKICSGALIVACSWLILKVTIELIMNHIIKNDGRDSPLTIYRGVILAIVMMFLIAPLFNFGYQVSTELTNAVINVSGFGNNQTENEGTISNAIVRSMIYEDEMDKKDADYLVENWKTVDINKKEGGIAGIGDVYTYSVNFFMLVVLSILIVFLFFFIGIQMAKRVMELALFKIIGPFCCTGLTNPQSQAFTTWIKSTMGLFLVTIVQFVSLGLLLNMFGVAFKDNGIIAGLFLIIGALLFIISTPQLINTLLNQQAGFLSNFGEMYQLMAISQATSTWLKVAGGALAFGPKVISSAVNKVNIPSIRNSFNDSNKFNSKTPPTNPFKTSSPLKPTNSSFLNTNPIKMNAIRQQYQNQLGNTIDNGGGKNLFNSKKH